MLTAVSSHSFSQPTVKLFFLSMCSISIIAGFSAGFSKIRKSPFPVLSVLLELDECLSKSDLHSGRLPPSSEILFLGLSFCAYLVR